MGLDGTRACGLRYTLCHLLRNQTYALSRCNGASYEPHLLLDCEPLGHVQHGSLSEFLGLDHVQAKNADLFSPIHSGREMECVECCVGSNHSTCSRSTCTIQTGFVPDI